MSFLVLAAVLAVLGAAGQAQAQPGQATRGPVVRASPRPQPRVENDRSSAPEIVFMAPGIPGGGLVQEIFTMNLDGSALTQITHDGLSKFLPHFSPNGKRLIYTKFLVGQYNDPDAQTDVVVYDFATKAETRLTHTGHSFQPVWSPDGQRIAFGSINGEALWIMNADGSDVRLIGAPGGAPDDRRWNDFAWSSDDWILFTGEKTRAVSASRRRS